MATFSEWLQGEMTARGLSQSELARKAGVTRAAINRVLTEMRGPGPELCVGIARALGYKPDDVFKIAGILPQGGEPPDIMANRLLSIFDDLPPDVQEQLVYIALGLRDREQSRAGELSSGRNNADCAQSPAET